VFGVPRGASKHARPRLGNWVLSIVSWFGQWVTLDIMLDELCKTRAGTLICLQMGVMESRRSRIGTCSGVTCALNARRVKQVSID
jgi:hypothetical protein